MISDQQQKRIDKLICDEFYLIGLNDNDEENDDKDNKKNTEILMTGSTKNVYKIELHKNGSLSCNCPDSTSHAKKHGVVCKHICFIYLKICKCTDMKFFETKRMKKSDICKLKLRTLAMTQTGIAKQYYDIYLELQKGDDPIDFDIKQKEIDEEDCPICFDGLEGTLKYCPVCSNAIHQKCVEKWLTTNDTCVYCRSDIWKQYGGNCNINKKNVKSYTNLA